MTYEYVCEACGHQWEAEQSIKDKPLAKCVSCGKSSAKRLVSGGTGFLLKGGGWYADGYGSTNAAKPAASSSDKADTKAAPADAGSKETKPATPSSGGSSNGASGSSTASSTTAASAKAS